MVSSLMEGWKYWTDTDGIWHYRGWHYIKPPGWRAYRSRSLEDICAFQYVASNQQVIGELERMTDDRFIVVRHEDLVAAPAEHYTRIRQFLELPASAHWDAVVATLDSRVWTRGGSHPQPGKWRELHGSEVERIRGRLEPVNEWFYDADEHLDTA